MSQCSASLVGVAGLGRLVLKLHFVEPEYEKRKRNELKESTVSSFFTIVCFLCAVNSPGYQPQPMILTSAGQLPSKAIVHVVGQRNPVEIRSIVLGVLKLCEGKNFQSVSFPALGTGKRTQQQRSRTNVKSCHVVGLMCRYRRFQQPQTGISTWRENVTP